METQQIRLVRGLEDLKNKIRRTQDRREITAYILQAIQMAIPIEPRLVYNSNDEATPNYKGKTNAIDSLNYEVQRVSSRLNLEDIHFQVSGALTILMTKFVDGLHGIEQALNLRH